MTSAGAVLEPVAHTGRAIARGAGRARVVRADAPASGVHRPHAARNPASRGREPARNAEGCRELCAGSLWAGRARRSRRSRRSRAGSRRGSRFCCSSCRATTLLLLDEPTDNLDLASAEALESALARFEGTVLAVTHDRWFARSFDRFIVFGADGAVYESDAAGMGRSACCPRAEPAARSTRVAGRAEARGARRGSASPAARAPGRLGS